MNKTGSGTHNYEQIADWHISQIKKYVGIRDTDNVLEIGCGIGRCNHDHSWPQAAFVGMVLGQTSLLGLCVGLGTDNWLVRLVGFLGALVYLGGLFNVGVGEFEVQLVLMTVFAGAAMALLLLIGRYSGLRTSLSRVDGEHKITTQFSIRQLMTLTFLVAILMTAAKWLRPHVGISGELPLLLLISVPFIILGLVSAWAVLGTKYPRLGTIAALLLSPTLGFGLKMVIELIFDVGYGGNFYAVVDPQKNFSGVQNFTASKLIQYSQIVRDRINKKYPGCFVHPEYESINGASHML